MTRMFRVVCVLVLGATLAAAWHGIGWTRPEPGSPLALAPYTERLFDPAYADAAAQAGRHLRDMRDRLGLPALSAAVSIDGRLIWAGAVGWADPERRIPADPDTRFRIGSTSKAVTATALARMVEAGSIDLDAPISRYLPRPPNPAWAPVTPRQLASHTAGIVGYAENRDLRGLAQSLLEWGEVGSAAESLEFFDDNDLLFPPGEGFHYSSFDTVLLSAAMEAAAGRTFPDLLDALVLAPLGIDGAGADRPARPVTGQAVFHAEAGGAWKPWRAVDHSYKWAGGGLLASPSELALIGGGWFDPAFLSPDTAALFWRPQRLADGRVNPQSYAIGWRANPQTLLFGAGRPVLNVHHGGVSKGALSWLNLYPEFRLAVALNTNARVEPFQPFFREADYAITRAFVARRLPSGA